MNEEEKMKKIENELKRGESVDKLINNPISKGLKAGLLSLLPTGVGDGINETIDEAIDLTLGYFRNKKQEEFFDIIRNSNTITKEMVKVDFVMGYIKALEAVNRLSTNAKVKYIANLFKNTFCIEGEKNIDEYEEWLANLSSLSYREIKILIMLYESNKKDEKKEVFYKNIEKELGLDEENTIAILTSASKSGFCKEKVGAIVGYTGGEFYTTNYFERFLEKICN
ncbi:hypothetical protein [Clostridium baratii]|uniref:hypothetical protein n=1 Tax=Clostridium baratii TaxID=1561 RepID=UPI003D3358DD